MRIIILLFFVVITAQRSLGATEAEFAAKVFGGEQNLAIVKSAQKVTACILTPEGEPRRPETWNHDDLLDPSTYKQGSRVDVPAAQLPQLRATLLDRTLDDPDSAKGCIPIFDVRFTFTDQSGSLDVDLCFSCDLLFVSRTGKVVGGGDFDPAHKKLLALSRILFPNDKDLSELAKQQ